MPTKRERLAKLPKSAITELLQWFWWRGSIDDDYKSMLKDDAVEDLERRFSVPQLDEILAGFSADRPHFDDDLLARVIGLPTKETMLASRSRDDLRDVMEDLEDDGRVMVAWRSFAKDELASYLETKFSAVDLATLLGILRPKKQPKEKKKASAVALTAPSPPHAPPPLPPTSTPPPRAGSSERRFGQYVLERSLVSGGMGEAWQARATDGVRVFIKRVRDSSAPIAHALLREQGIYQRLQNITASHDHLLAVLDWVRADGWAGLVTEFADGGDLESYVERNGALSTSAARAIAGELANGLITLHRNNIVHRDIKPANVVHSRLQWRISDFGIAKNLDRSQTKHTFQMMGTSGYMAPEQREGRDANPSMDVYAFGKVLTFLVTTQTDPDHVHYPKYSELIRACTERDPTRRPTAADLPSLLRNLET